MRRRDPSTRAPADLSRSEPREAGGLHDTPAGLHAVIPAVLREARQRHGTLFAVQRSWRRLVGNELAAHTQPVSVRNKRLVINADRPGDSFALNYRRSRLLERVKRLTRGNVEELIVRAGEVHAVPD